MYVDVLPVRFTRVTVDANKNSYKTWSLSGRSAQSAAYTNSGILKDDSK